ncbi:DnaB-like helicase N-terminal domain-containing protein [Streptomyces sp. NPDC053048]|uniref:DnaB-like helicase N-terminal domain-containing protein n=1 Tax=Streptomyces sp. NPDC053048 TaxID=3365694 RepID=UPI0037D2D5C3
MSASLEGLPGKEALVLAEQALLGALLLRPHTLSTVAPWLAAGHFYLPQHTALYAAMLDLTERGHAATAEIRPTSEQGLSWVTEATTRAAQQAPGLTPSYVHTLISTCPEPAHALTYGRMVLAGHARRTIAEHAARLAQTARHTRDGEPHVEAVCARADALSSVLNALAQHWRPHPSTPAHTTPDVPPGVRRQDEQRHDDEQAFLSAATTRPTALKEIRAFLHAEDFGNSLHAELFRCLAALHHRGEAIDPVTLVWEAQHRDVLAHTTLQSILDTCQPSGGDPVYWATRILRHSLLDTAAITGKHIGRLAANTTLTPQQLITASRRALDDLTATRMRWHRSQHGPTALPNGFHDRPPPRATSRCTPIEQSRVARTR